MVSKASSSSASSPSPPPMTTRQKARHVAQAGQPRLKYVVHHLVPDGTESEPIEVKEAVRERFDSQNRRAGPIRIVMSAATVLTIQAIPHQQPVRPAILRGLNLVLRQLSMIQVPPTRCLQAILQGPSLSECVRRSERPPAVPTGRQLQSKAAFRKLCLETCLSLSQRSTQPSVCIRATAKGLSGYPPTIHFKQFSTC